MHCVDAGVSGLGEVDIVHPVRVLESVVPFAHVQLHFPGLQKSLAVHVQGQSGLGVSAVEVEDGALAVHLHALGLARRIGDQKLELFGSRRQLELPQVFVGDAVVLAALEILGLVEDVLLVGNNLRVVDHEQLEVVLVYLFGKLDANRDAFVGVVDFYRLFLDLTHNCRHLEVFFFFYFFDY